MTFFAALGVLIACASPEAGAAPHPETNMVVEISFQSQKSYDNPFIDFEQDGHKSRRNDYREISKEKMK